MSITKMTKAAALEKAVELFMELSDVLSVDIYSRSECRYVESFDPSTDSMVDAIEEGRPVRMGIEDHSLGRFLIARFIPSRDGNVVVDIPQ